MPEPAGSVHILGLFEEVEPWVVFVLLGNPSNNQTTRHLRPSGSEPRQVFTPPDPCGWQMESVKKDRVKRRSF